jgi:transposase
MRDFNHGLRELGHGLAMIGAGTQHQLDQLFESRYHGATTITGIKFQVAYSVLRALDLYDSDAPTSIHLEGIEDIDVKGRRKVKLPGFKISDEYVQVKTSKSDWDWSRFINSKILDNFLPVYSANPSAGLLIVTNFGYSGKLSELFKFCNGARAVLSNKIKADVISLCKRAGYPKVEPLELLKRIRLERISDKELESRITSAITRSFNLTTPNSDLYLLVLVSKFLELAARRGEVTRNDLEQIRLFVQEQMQLGMTNLAIQNGWIERLNFVPEEHPEDYYEGKNARPGHILAGLDVQRPGWNDRLSEALERSYVCVLRTASGQGKSTLLYRYAYEQGEGSISETAARFGVCTAFVKKMLRQWRATGDLAPLPHGGGKPKSLTERQRQLLKRKVREQNDISLAELHSFLGERESVSVHASTISRALSGLGLPLKKRA